MKMEGFVKPFRGQNDDWHVFCQKFSVLADLSGWSASGGTAAIRRLTLFLEGDAFLVYSRLSDADKASADNVKAAMIKSFGFPKSAAYSQFTSRRFQPDEGVETCVADLNRLLVLSGHKDGGDKDPVMIEELLADLPHDIAQQVHLAFAGQKMTVTKCCAAVQALVLVKRCGQTGPRASAAATMTC